MKYRFPIAVLFLLSFALACSAHVGSPDVYFQGNAGPYQLIVMVRTPQMIPGVAEIEIRSKTQGVREIKVTPLYITGSGSKYPPPPDSLKAAQGDAQFFTGNVWLMDAGSWQVRIAADGALGPGSLALPVPAFARSTLPMQKSLAALLFGLMVLLVAALVAIFGAARREGGLQSGEHPGPVQKRGAWLVMTGALVITLAALALGNWWWTSVAAANVSRKIYQPPNLDVSLTGNMMTLRVAESRWHTRRPDTVMTEIIPDHGHLMHLFLVRLPQMDRLYHLHPQQQPTDAATFVENLPAVDEGHYKIFSDIVRASGFPDTMVTEVDLPQTNGSYVGDDSKASAASLTEQGAGNLVAPLSDGARMVWERDPGALASNRLLLFRFRVEDAGGKPVTDLEPYMGMAGHAEFIASDFSVFAHVHPDGSVSMAALDLAAANGGAQGAQNSAGSSAMPGMDMPGMSMPGMTMSSANSSGSLPAEVSFPYGFPKPGLYRIFIQVKRKGKIETGVFDAKVN
jgi:hypothetical protein